MRRAAAVLPFVVCAVCAATACAAALPRVDGVGVQEVAPRAASRGAPAAIVSRSLIPAYALDLDPGLTVYDVVGRYWPQVLRPPTLLPGLFTPDPRGDVVGVYFGDSFGGGQEQLRLLRATSVASVRRLSRAEEFARWGRTHPGGALVITLR